MGRTAVLVRRGVCVLDSTVITLQGVPIMLLIYRTLVRSSAQLIESQRNRTSYTERAIVALEHPHLIFSPCRISAPRKGTEGFRAMIGNFIAISVIFPRKFPCILT